MGGILKAIQGIFAFANAWMRKGNREADMEAGANKLELARRDAQDEAKKKADNIYDVDRPDRFKRK